MPLTRGDQIPKTVVDVEAPGARALAVTFENGNQANVRKAQLGLSVLSGDLKSNVRADPLLLVLDEVQMSVQHAPHDFLTRHEFGDLLGALVKVLVTVGKHRTELVGGTIDFS